LRFGDQKEVIQVLHSLHPCSTRAS